MENKARRQTDRGFAKTPNDMFAGVETLSGVFAVSLARVRASSATFSFAPALGTTTVSRGISGVGLLLCLINWLARSDFHEVLVKHSLY